MNEDPTEFDKSFSGYSKRASKRDDELSNEIKSLSRNDPNYWSERHRLEADNRVTNDIDFFCHDGDESKTVSRTFTFVTSTNRSALEAKLNSSMALTRLHVLEKQIQTILTFSKFSFFLLLFIAVTVTISYYG
jgi:hypothetical protein